MKIVTSLSILGLLCSSVAFSSEQIPPNETEIKKSVYRLDKKRYEKFTNSAGSVFVPAMGLSFEDSARSYLCEPQLKNMQEKLRLLDTSLNANDQKNKQAIVELINKCVNGDFAPQVNASASESGDVKIEITPPDAVDPSNTKPGAPAKSPEVKVNKNWKK